MRLAILIYLLRFDRIPVYLLIGKCTLPYLLTFQCQKLRQLGLFSLSGARRRLTMISASSSNSFHPCFFRSLIILYMIFFWILICKLLFFSFSYVTKTFKFDDLIALNWSKLYILFYCLYAALHICLHHLVKEAGSGTVIHWLLAIITQRPG